SRRWPGSPPPSRRSTSRSGATSPISPRRPRMPSRPRLGRLRRGRARRPGPPDFIGVGALGSGTAWWHGLLLRHPDVTGPATGERALQFFAPFCDRELTDADVAAYHSRFEHRPGKVTGEWTGRYMQDAWTPPLLARVAPEARL